MLNKTNWESVWFDKKLYSKKLINDINIRKLITSSYQNCGIANVYIERPSDKVIVIIKTSKPGILIGKKGSDIEKITKSLSDLAGSKVDIKIIEVDNPDINASLISQFIAKQLENRVAFKKVMKKTMQSAMKQGALGIKISCSGRLGGAEIARIEWYKEGTIPLHTLRCNIDYAIATAQTTYGSIGVKVWINKKV